MNKTAQYMVKAAQLRAQADKLEKIAFTLVDVGVLGLLSSGSVYGVHQFMKNRAAAKAATEAAAQAAQAAKAAQAAQAAQAAKAAEAAARKSKLLRDALGLGALGGAVGGLAGGLAGGRLAGGRLAGGAVGEGSL